MMIRILCIVVALIAAVWISYKVELSGGWTVFFTLLVSAAVGFIVTITPLMLASVVPVVTPVRTGYRPSCYVSDTDYGTLLEDREVTVTYYYVNDTLYNVKLNNYSCTNRIDLRDSDVFTQGGIDF